MLRLFLALALILTSACKRTPAIEQPTGFNRPSWPSVALREAQAMEPFNAIVLDRQTAEIPLNPEQRAAKAGRSSIHICGVVLRPSDRPEFAITSTDATAEEIDLFSTLQVGHTYTFPDALRRTKQ